MRKSRDLRLTQARELFQLYKNQNMSADKRARFISDMIVRIETGKNLTPGQRRWLDSLIEEGEPEIKGDKVLLAKIESVFEMQGISGGEKSALRDFHFKLQKGWKLSEKQLAWMEVILEKAEKIRVNGPYIPDADTIEKLKLCEKMSRGYSPTWWATHGGTARALRNVSDFLEGGELIDEWSVNKLMSTMRSRLDELLTKRYVNTGDLVWCRTSWDKSDVGVGVVFGDPEICESGKIKYPILLDGKVVLLHKDKISKRKPRS